jgi:hypothetical protein
MKYYAMKVCVGMEVYIHVFLTLALVGDYLMGGRVGPRTGLNDVENI